jgi:hypothetical protein
MAQLVEALRYKSKDQGFESQWVRILLLHCGPGVDSASKRNEYQEYLMGRKCSWSVGETTLPSSCADCVEILGISTPWSRKGLSV